MSESVSLLVLACPWCRRVDEYQDEHDRHVVDCPGRTFQDFHAPWTIPCEAEVLAHSPEGS